LLPASPHTVVLTLAKQRTVASARNTTSPPCPPGPPSGPRLLRAGACQKLRDGGRRSRTQRSDATMGARHAARA